MNDIDKLLTSSEKVAPLYRPTIYLESLDSVRFNEDSLNDPRLIYPTMEVILHILKGDQINLPEPYSFDSCSFLSIASQALEARRNNSIIHNHSNIYWNPFHLTLREDILHHTSYLKMVKEYFERPNDRVVLSAWYDLHDIDARKDVVNSLANRVDFEEYLENGNYRYKGLFYIKEYFDEVGWERKPLLKQKLDNYIDFLQTHNDLTTYGEEAPFYEVIKNGFSILRQNNIPFTDRSQIRIKGKDWLPENQLQMLLEFIDTCYNMILSNFSRCKQPSFCTNQKSIGKEAVSGEALAYRVNSQLNPYRKGVAYPVSAFLEDNNQFSTLASALDSEKVWQEVWNIVSDSDWLHLRYQLNALENAGYQNTTQYENLYERFIELIASGMANISVERNNLIKRIGLFFDPAKFAVNVLINAMNVVPNISAVQMQMPTVFQAVLNYSGQQSLQNQADFFFDYYKYALINSKNRNSMTFGLVQSLLKKR